MVADETKAAPGERYLSPAAVAGRFLVRIDSVQRWIDEGRLRTVTGKRGEILIPESAVLEFQRTAYRRENFTGIDHALHSWPSDDQGTSSLPALPVQNFARAEAKTPIWPFPQMGANRQP